MWPFGQKSKHLSFLHEVKGTVLQGDLDRAYEQLLEKKGQGFMLVAKGFGDYMKNYQALIAKVGNKKGDALAIAEEIDGLEREAEALMRLYDMWC